MSAPLIICKKCGMGRSARKCKQCMKVATAAWRSRNPERAKELAAKYYYSDPDKQRARSLEFHYANPEKSAARSAAYHSKNREKALAVNAKWRADNPERIRERGAAAVAELTDSYVAGLFKLPPGVVPQELIELKRVQIQITRKLKELKK